MENNNKKLKIAVLGLGYVGLPLLAALASKKRYECYGIDKNVSKIEELKRGISPLETVDSYKIQNLKIEFFYDISKIDNLDLIFFCLPTPVNHQGIPNLEILDLAISDCASKFHRTTIFAVVSTVYPGYMDDTLSMLEIGNYAFCPEREDPGNQDFDIKTTNRIMAASNEYSYQAVCDVLQNCCGTIFRASTIKAAEMCKLLENTHRLVNIAFMNEFTSYCESLSLDVREINDLAATKPFGYTKFYPGIGIGGHCIPVDPHYLKFAVKKQGCDTPFIDLAFKAEKTHRKKIINRIEREILQTGVNEVLFIGASYKKNVGDIRESPSVKIIQTIQKKQIVKIYVLDPHVAKIDFPLNPDGVIFTNSIDTIKNVPKLIFLMVDHDSVTRTVKLLNLNSRVIDLTANSTRKK